MYLEAEFEKHSENKNRVSLASTAWLAHITPQLLHLLGDFKPKCKYNYLTQ